MRGKTPKKTKREKRLKDLCKSDSATLQQRHPEQSTARLEIPLPRSEIGDGEIGIRTSGNIKELVSHVFFFSSRTSSSSYFKSGILLVKNPSDLLRGPITEGLLVLLLYDMISNCIQEKFEVMTITPSSDFYVYLLAPQKLDMMLRNITLLYAK
ncbi:hypothetical protein CMV_020111 [Castanea mollissima]|uniref:Uncharacterized protein n=1 Tax=Castanea mollissima TaxID=60419 RepID=A0A8J4QM08_9ROSI|nr:hypothetical protein CMV_020111 [Castanea mollissima]